MHSDIEIRIEGKGAKYLFHDLLNELTKLDFDDQASEYQPNGSNHNEFLIKGRVPLDKIEEVNALLKRVRKSFRKMGTPLVYYRGQEFDLDDTISRDKILSEYRIYERNLTQMMPSFE